MLGNILFRFSFIELAIIWKLYKTILFENHTKLRKSGQNDFVTFQDISVDLMFLNFGSFCFMLRIFGLFDKFCIFNGIMMLIALMKFMKDFSDSKDGSICEHIEFIR